MPRLDYYTYYCALTMYQMRRRSSGSSFVTAPTTTRRPVVGIVIVTLFYTTYMCGPKWVVGDFLEIIPIKTV